MSSHPSTEVVSTIVTAVIYEPAGATLDVILAAFPTPPSHEQLRQWITWMISADMLKEDATQDPPRYFVRQGGRAFARPKKPKATPEPSSTGQTDSEAPATHDSAPTPPDDKQTPEAKPHTEAGAPTTHLTSGSPEGKVNASAQSEAQNQQGKRRKPDEAISAAPAQPATGSIASETNTTAGAGSDTKPGSLNEGDVHKQTTAGTGKSQTPPGVGKSPTSAPQQPDGDKGSDTSNAATLSTTPTGENAGSSGATSAPATTPEAQALIAAFAPVIDAALRAAGASSAAAKPDSMAMLANQVADEAAKAGSSEPLSPALRGTLYLALAALGIAVLQHIQWSFWSSILVPLSVIIAIIFRRQFAKVLPYLWAYILRAGKAPAALLSRRRSRLQAIVVTAVIVGSLLIAVGFYLWGKADGSARSTPPGASVTASKQTGGDGYETGLPAKGSATAGKVGPAATGSGGERASLPVAAVEPTASVVSSGSDRASKLGPTTGGSLSAKQTGGDARSPADHPLDGSTARTADQASPSESGSIRNPVSEIRNSDLPAYPSGVGAYALVDGRWRALPRNNGRNVQTYADSTLMKTIAAELEATATAGKTSPLSTVAVGHVAFDGRTPVPTVSAKNLTLVYVGKLASVPAETSAKYPLLRTYPPLEIAPVTLAGDGVRQAPLVLVAPGFVGFGSARVNALVDQPKEGVAVLRATAPIAPGRYAFACGAEAYEVMLE